MSELNRLRCQLRVVNIEYSALVRCKTGEATSARMAGLRTERRLLMALIALERQAAATERPLEHALPSALRSALHRKIGSHRSAYPFRVFIRPATGHSGGPSSGSVS